MAQTLTSNTKQYHWWSSLCSEVKGMSLFIFCPSDMSFFADSLPRLRSSFCTSCWSSLTLCSVVPGMCDSMPATHQRVVFESDPNGLGLNVIVKTKQKTTMHKMTSRCVRKGRNAYKIKQLQQSHDQSRSGQTRTTADSIQLASEHTLHCCGHAYLT